MGRTHMKHGERAYTVGHERIDFEALRKIVVLNDQASQQLASELVVKARAKNISAEHFISSIRVLEVRVVDLRLDNQALCGPERCVRSEAAAITQEWIVYISRDRLSQVHVKSNLDSLAEVAVDIAEE